MLLLIFISSLLAAATQGQEAPAGRRRRRQGAKGGLARPDACPRATTSARARRTSMQLANPKTSLSTLDALYREYGGELKLLHAKLKPWCEKTMSCKFCDREAELLYMLVRLWKPRRIFEMAPNRGYSSNIILEALARNSYGHLDSFDIHDAAREHVSESLAARWTFTKADVQELTADDPGLMERYDFIFIDALHEVQFAEWYVRALLGHAVGCDTPVMIHDIVADASGGGRESAPVYRYLAFARDVVGTWTLAPNMLPSPFSPAPDAATALESIRTANGVGGHQKYFVCHPGRYGADPSIFFVKRAARALPSPPPSE